MTDAWRELFPFASNYFELARDVRMHYVDEGPLESGAATESATTILAVHGNPTWSFYYRRLASEFRGTHRVVLPDHIGCGLSDKPRHYPYTLASRIEDLSALIKHLDLRNITLVVHDWGGAIGLGTAIRLRDRFRRLFILNTGAFPPPFVPLRIRLCRTPLVGHWAMRRLNAFAGAAIHMAVGRGKKLPAAVREGLLAPYDNWANRIAIARFVEDIPFTTRHRTWQTLQRIEGNLPKLAHLPTTMIWGMQDWCFNAECLSRMRTAFPQADVHEIPSAGHYVMEDAADEILALMRDRLA